MIYIVGDTHGNQRKWLEQIDPALAAGDILIVCGDFGIGFWNGVYWTQECFFDWLSEKTYTVLFVDGNHENFRQLDQYSVEDWCGGRVHKLRRNLIHLMRGEVYSIEGYTIFAFGGGYSVDRYRREEDVSWWPQQLPSEAEYQNGEGNLQRHCGQVDYIITHTAPQETVYYLSTLRRLGIKGPVAEEMALTSFLDCVQQRTGYQRWYFGHFHVDMELWRGQTAVFNTIRELTSGKIVRQWSA